MINREKKQHNSAYIYGFHFYVFCFIGFLRANHQPPSLIKLANIVFMNKTSPFQGFKNKQQKKRKEILMK